jgi:hypothetical protein
MGRRVTSGVVGGSGLGTINVVASTITTTTTNGDLTFEPNGTGRILFAKDAQLQTQNDLRFADADSSNWVALQAPATIATNYTLTLPSAISASNGFALTSDTAGNLSWSAAGAALTDNNTDSNTNYLAFTTQTSGILTAARVATTTRPLTYQPSTGTLTATAYVESSSIALKENLVPITDALSKILHLQSYIYDRKDGSVKNEVGLIAEYVNPIIPELVLKDEKGDPTGIRYTKLTAYLVESIKSLKQEIDNLRQKVETA